MSLWTILSKLRGYYVRQKFNLKFTFLHLTFQQVRPNKTEFLISDLWNGSIFPNYGPHNSTSFTSTLKTKSKFNRLDSSSIVTVGILNKLLNVYNQLQYAILWSLNTFKRSLGDGVLYLRGLFCLFFFDALITDDEPLWEPIEWSLVQSWILFIFAFAWIAENLISSRFGSYTGRDKRVWAAWYKTFWLIEGWYVMSLGLAALFVITPFYHEISYTLPLVMSWWNWYSRVFFFKFISLYALVLYISYYLQLQLGTSNVKKSLLLIIVINLFLAYLLYTNFIMSFFAYFTDPNWYAQTRLVDYIQLSHEPNKWSWGSSKRDHFSYHKSTTVLWFKNDGPFASAFLLFHIMFFLALFSLNLFWLTLLRRVYATNEITYTYTTYCVSSLRQFWYFFFFLLSLAAFSLLVQYWRLPVEYLWIANTRPLWQTILIDFCDFPKFLLSTFA